MALDNFRKMYITELQELRSAEDMLANALPGLARHADASDLAQAMDRHARQTDGQRERLAQLLRAHEAKPEAHRDSSMSAMIKEADRWAGKVDVPALRDAGLISSLQRMMHYEIAVYGSLATWAKQLSLDEDLGVLLDILEEEKRSDQDFSTLAKKAVNPEAATT